MKAILVIDMPTRCEDCICYRQPKYEYIGDCGVTLRPLTSAERVNRPSWCPLKHLPQKHDEGIMREQKGWNRCLEEILGEE